MKTCSLCGTDLPEPIFEYGDVRAPTCFHCFIEPPRNDQTDEEISRMEEENRELQEEIDDLRDQIFDLENDISVNKRKIRNLVDGKTRRIVIQKESILAWTRGEARKVPDTVFRWGQISGT